MILIHTSVKLVTYAAFTLLVAAQNFNPHEREARDTLAELGGAGCREILIHTSVKLVTW